jgi:adenylosuccinate synthase
LDLELVKFGAELNGFTDIVITKFDVLNSFKIIKLCIGYVLNGKKVSYLDVNAETFAQVKPVYKIMKGWNTTLDNVKRFTDLPKAAKLYIKYIYKFIGIPISMVSIGAERNQVIKINRKDLL